MAAPFCSHPPSAHHYDGARGQVTCSACGEVITDQQFELDPAFSVSDRRGGGGPSAGGMAPLRGTGGAGLMRGSNFARPSRPTHSHGAHGASRPSIDAARRQIHALARTLSIKASQVDVACGFFRYAVNANAVVGARPAVLAACLYLVCRIEKTPHMVHDFADATHESVEAVISYLKVICAATHTSVPSIDPSFYISRFVKELELGALEVDVSIYALKIVRAMSKEWIATGRRPLGVCAAAVLVACRTFGVDRPVSSVAPLARLSESTILRRLDEFCASAPSRVSNIDDYHAPTTGDGSTTEPAAMIRGGAQSVIQKTDELIRSNQMTALYYEQVNEALRDAPKSEDRVKRWSMLIDMMTTELATPMQGADDRDLTKLSQARQLQVLRVDPSTVSRKTKLEVELPEVGIETLAAAELLAKEHDMEAGRQQAADATSTQRGSISPSFPLEMTGVEIILLDSLIDERMAEEYVIFDNERRVLSQRAFEESMKAAWDSAGTQYENDLARALAASQQEEDGSAAAQGTRGSRKSASSRKRPNAAAAAGGKAPRTAVEAVGDALKRRTGGAQIDIDGLVGLLPEEATAEEGNDDAFSVW